MGWAYWASHRTGANGAGRSGAAKAGQAPNLSVAPMSSGSRDPHNVRAGQQPRLNTAVHFCGETIVVRSPKEFPGPTRVGERKQVVVCTSLCWPRGPDCESIRRHGAPSEDYTRQGAQCPATCLARRSRPPVWAAVTSTYRGAGPHLANVSLQKVKLFRARASVARVSILW